MDPNETLSRIRGAVQEHQSGLLLSSDGVDNLVELVAALDEWMMKGGFLPEDWQKAHDADIAALRQAIGRPAYEQAVCQCTGVNAAPSIDCPVHSPER